MQQFSGLLSWRLFSAEHVSGVSRPSSGAPWLQRQPLVLSSYRGDSRALFVVRPRVHYPDMYFQLNMFRAFSRPSSGAQRLQWQPLVLPSYHGDSRAVFVVGPRTQHECHHDTKVKPEAATAVIELLMMGGKTPETCWDVNKRHDNKLKNCCIRLVIYLNCTMMHGLTNLKFYEGKTRGCHCSHWAPDDGRETPETCWAVNKRQDNKLKNCYIRLVIYLN